MTSLHRIAEGGAKQNPAVVQVAGRDYSVYFHHATGAPCTVLAHKAHHQTQRLNINGPTARAAIAKAVQQ